MRNEKAQSDNATAGISCFQIKAKKVILSLSHKSGQRLLLLGCKAAEQGHLCKWKMSLSLVPWFQRDPQARQCVAGLDFLQGHLKRPLRKPMRMKPRLKWKPEDVKCARSMIHLLRKAEGTERSQLKSVCVLQDVELERWGYPSHQSLETWSCMICWCIEICKFVC